MRREVGIGRYGGGGGGGERKLIETCQDGEGLRFGPTVSLCNRLCYPFYGCHLILREESFICRFKSSQN